MPTYLRTPTTPLTTTTLRTGLLPLKTVGFPSGTVVTGFSRPLSDAELWPLYNFEIHARSCDGCHDPYEVHKSGGRLCATGHAYAQEVAKVLFSNGDGSKLYSMRSDERHADQPMRVELPKGYPNVHGLLRAVERGMRQRRQTPVISYDKNYYVASRQAEAPVVTYAKRPSRKDSGAGHKSGHRHSTSHRSSVYDVRTLRDNLPELDSDSSSSSDDESYVTKVNSGPQRRQSTYTKYTTDSRKPSKRHSRISGYHG
ncbi:MAG: hypothetical protein M1828_000669 [Chrysothrix sp. TS-e1954]|nr:MAG: hypothetical protein M1828_000669 [Chrysothrix sp. TS-e1954]